LQSKKYNSFIKMSRIFH